MSKQYYDIIGDIHGAYGQLKSLVAKLGYHHSDGKWSHPEGRMVAFLGDFIDPKQHGDHDVRGVLKLVKGMMDDGIAVAVMGNHEFNAVAYATPDPHKEGVYLRPHETRNRETGRRSYETMKGGCHGAEWLGWIEWFKSLPMFLELDGMRLVHAFWKQEAIDELKAIRENLGCPLLMDDDFLFKANRKGEREYELVEWVLKGLEINLPAKQSYEDHQGIKRFKFRAKWFENEPAGKGIADLVFPFGSFEIENRPLPGQYIEMFPGYTDHEPPVFFGHYFKPADSPLVPELPNLVCLDHSVAKGGPLVAYRWSGEQSLRPENYSIAPLLSEAMA